MRYIERVFYSVAIFLVLLAITGCSGNNSSSQGVAEIKRAPAITTAGFGTKAETKSVSPAAPSPQASSSNDASSDKAAASESADDENADDENKETDEEIATRFAECMRGKGFNTADPEVNADGTINMGSLRQSIFNDPKFDRSNQTAMNALRECVPILREGTFSRTRTQEDVVELQDSMLKFAECLRGRGVDVSDPDFSDGVRGGFQSMFEGIDRDKHREDIRECATEFRSRRGR